jgi:hypothetical protein
MLSPAPNGGDSVTTPLESLALVNRPERESNGELTDEDPRHLLGPR